MRKILLALVIVMAAASFAVADTIYLRDGRTVRGTVLGFVNGRFVVRVEPQFSTLPSATTDPNVARARANEGEIQYFRPAEVDRIEIEGRSVDEARFETRSVQVPLESNWIDTGIDLRRNERVRITATGTILVGRARISPDGLRSADPNAPLPRAPEGELIGAIGDERNAPIIELGSTKEFVADRDGRLYLTANRSSFSDARGSFTVLVRRERDLNAIDNPENPRRRLPGVRSRDRQPGDNRGRDRSPRDVNIDVPATSRGTDTGLDVQSGDQVTFTASGTIVAGRRIGSVGPEGAATSGFGAIIGTRPVPVAGAGALIGYIRMSNGQMSQPFLIGNQLTLTVPADGRLFLAVNDDNYTDNSGTFTVKISY
jgi:hypothetical protein